MNPDETQEAEASQQEEENIDSDTEETTDEEESSEEESNDVDYKAELEALLADNQKKGEQLGKAEHKIQELKQEAKTGRGPSAAEIEQMVADAVTKQMGGVEKTALKTAAQQMAASMTQNPDEAALILHHYENTIAPTGDLSRDINNAYILANSKRFAAELSEAKRKFQSPKPEKGGGTGHRKANETTTAPKLSAREASFVRSAGMKWNAKMGRYEGKHVALAYDEGSKSWRSTRINQN